ncbi:LOW QUALITY PROTEIN: S-phase kinase-associated protein 1 [Fukomys damarensis]|uniref:LOW QUALITY PROTEIN: S-phase kinase-associated protein 1 n=1 Tax=Fukomys damarensis TaxID=885580 RepID=UPI001455B612|nr:LOW QUALITY PROTEIN: S-phase kinase-associated protein 1 [Fukomys damarensis]
MAFCVYALGVSPRKSFKSSPVWPHLPAPRPLGPIVLWRRSTVPSIKSQSSNGEIFEVDVEIAKQSVTIKAMLEDLEMDDEGNDDPAPLPHVNAAIFKKLIQWCTHQNNDRLPPEDNKNNNNKKSEQIDDIPVWDQEFLNVDQGTLFELIVAANYLDIKDLLAGYLLDVTCKTGANMIKGKTPEEICKTFNSKNDFTEEEEVIIGILL